MRPYFHDPQASENIAQECNIQPYYLLNHQIIDLLYTTLIFVASRNRQLLHKRGSKVIAACMFNEHQAVGLFLAFDGTSTRTDPFIGGKKYRS